MRQRDMFQKNCVSKFCLKKFSLSVATCNYIRYGRGGGQEIKNAICVLGLNMINDKVMTMFRMFHVQTIQYAKQTMCQTCQICSGLCNPLALALHPNLRWVEQVAKMRLQCPLFLKSLLSPILEVFKVPYSCEPLLIVSVPWICLDTSFKSS